MNYHSLTNVRSCGNPRCIEVNWIQLFYGLVLGGLDIMSVGVVAYELVSMCMVFILDYFGVG